MNNILTSKEQTYTANVKLGVEKIDIAVDQGLSVQTQSNL